VAAAGITPRPHVLGLGAVWTSVYPESRKVQAYIRNLNLPDNLIPLNSIMIGYPDEPADVKDKWDESKVTYWK
jgi:nitroreductase